VLSTITSDHPHVSTKASSNVNGSENLAINDFNAESF
jgi:hypothetical protein